MVYRETDTDLPLEVETALCIIAAEDLHQIGILLHLLIIARCFTVECITELRTCKDIEPPFIGNIDEISHFERKTDTEFIDIWTDIDRRGIGGNLRDIVVTVAFIEEGQFGFEIEIAPEIDISQSAD